VADEYGRFSVDSGDPIALGHGFALLMSYDDPPSHYVEMYTEHPGCMRTVFVGADGVCRAVAHHMDRPVSLDNVSAWSTDRLVEWARGGRVRHELVVAESEGYWDDGNSDDGDSGSGSGWYDSDDDDATHGEQTACPLCRAPASEAAFVEATASEREDKECVVCLAAPAALKLPVCGHTCLCADCAKHWTSSA